MAYRSSVLQLVDNLTSEQIAEIVAKARSIVDTVEGVEHEEQPEHNTTE